MTAEHALEVQTVFRGVVIGTKYVLPSSRHRSVRSRRQARRCTFAIDRRRWPTRRSRPRSCGTSPKISAGSRTADHRGGARRGRRVRRRRRHRAPYAITLAPGMSGAIYDGTRTRARCARSPTESRPGRALRSHATRTRAWTRRGHVPGRARGGRGAGAGRALLLERDREPLSPRHRARRGAAADPADGDARRSARAGARRLLDGTRAGELRDQATGAGDARACAIRPGNRRGSKRSGRQGAARRCGQRDRARAQPPSREQGQRLAVGGATVRIKDAGRCAAGGYLRLLGSSEAAREIFAEGKALGADADDVIGTMVAGPIGPAWPRRTRGPGHR